MIALLIIITQLILAFTILSMVYLFVSYKLKEKFETDRVIIEKNNTPDFENHIALFFSGITNEDQLLNQIQWLLTQDYKNYSAFFFCQDEIVEYNGFPNIKILSKDIITNNPIELKKIANFYFPSNPSKIVRAKSKTKLPNNFLFIQNEELFFSKFEDNLDSKINYSIPDNSFLQFWLESKIEFMKELIEGTNQATTISFRKIKTNIHFVVTALLLCSIALSVINSIDYIDKSFFDLVSILGSLFGLIYLAKFHLNKINLKQFNNGDFA